jgi:hypothetical protein
LQRKKFFSIIVKLKNERALSQAGAKAAMRLSEGAKLKMNK